MKYCIYAVILLFTSIASAAFSNYNSILIGDQASGMGGACVAMSQDTAAMPYYNPAGLAWLEGEAFSASVGIYKKFDTVYGTDSDLVQRGMKVNEGFFRAIPSSTASIVRFEDFLPDWTMAFSIVVPEYEYFQGEVNSTADNLSTLNFLDESLWVGGSMSRNISANQSFGFSLYYTARALTKVVSDRTLTGVNKQVYTEERSIKNNTLVAILGYQYKHSEDFIIGVSARLPSLHINGKGNYFDSLYETGSATIDIRNYTNEASQYRVPARLLTGVAYRMNPRTWLTADVQLNSGFSYLDMQASEIAEQIEHKVVWNGAVGLEYAWANWLKMRMGVFSNMSTHPNPDPSRVSGQADKVDQVGFSGNLSFRRKQIEYTFGGYYTGGRGRGAQRYEQSVQNVDKSQQVFTMLVGTSYYF